MTKRYDHWVADAVGQPVYEDDFVAYAGVLRQVGYIGLALDNHVILEPLDSENESPRVPAADIIKTHRQEMNR